MASITFSGSSILTIKSLVHNGEKVFHIRAIYLTVLWEVLTPFMHVQKL